MWPERLKDAGSAWGLRKIFVVLGLEGIAGPGILGGDEGAKQDSNPTLSPGP